MSRPPQPLFLARQSYRRRRLADAARLIPLLGTVLLLIPIFWSTGNSTSGGLVYVFVAWGGLIAVIGLLARALNDIANDPDQPDDPSDPEG